jgi:hypothetical protein
LLESDLISTTKRTERVFLIGLELKSGSSWQTRDSLDELAELAATAGGSVVGEGTQKLEAPVAGTFIGSGKAAEFAEFCRKERRGHGGFRRRAFPRAKPQPGKSLRLQGAGPDGADPGYFRPARPHARRQNCRSNWRSCSICCRA